MRIIEGKLYTYIIKSYSIISIIIVINQETKNNEYLYRNQSPLLKPTFGVRRTVEEEQHLMTSHNTGPNQNTMRAPMVDNKTVSLLNQPLGKITV